jgi:hypothetical protein
MFLQQWSLDYMQKKQKNQGRRNEVYENSGLYLFGL